MNLCSLDAVSVGLAWQLVFTLQFCGRVPQIAESGIIGVTIWLAYTADRILDSRRLDPDLPHTLRHRFHCQFQRPLSCIWIIAFSVDVMLMTTFATPAQIKWGLGCLLLVVVYLLRVQQRNARKRRFPKELQAGFLFGFGISLICWSELPSSARTPLMLSTVLTGLLFSINCATVAYWERGLDAVQEFASWTSPRSPTATPIALALAIQVAATAILFVMEIIPLFLGCCLLSSSLLLGIIFVASRWQRRCEPNTVVTVPPSGWELLADISLIFPPTFIVILTACCS